MTAYLFDKELEFRDGAAAASTTTHSTNPVAVDVLEAGDFKAVINVTAVDRTTGDETYVFTVQTDAAEAFSSPTTVATLPAITAPGSYEIPLSGELIDDFDPGAAFIRLTGTLGGTSPSITYGAFLVPVV